MLPHRSLGSSSLSVSRIALGSWRTFERMPRDDAERLLGHALESGIDFLDDARYNDETGQAPLQTGWSEVLFGELFRAVGADRDAVAVSNKLWWEFWPQQDAVGELESSLERMGFEWIDLLYCATLPDDVPVAVCTEQIAAVLATGRVRAWAVVNWSAAAITAACVQAQRNAIAAPCAAQLPYSLAHRAWVEDPAMDAALERAGASLVPSAVLSGGALSGKYAAAGGAGRLSTELDDPRWAGALRIGEALAAPARRLDTTPAALATAFTLRHPRTASTLIGATRADQVDEAIAAIALADRLTDADLVALRALGA
ncbi:MAG: aldo/keto reductase [Solirubrobacteraceae bacterium]